MELGEIKCHESRNESRLEEETPTVLLSVVEWHVFSLSLTLPLETNQQDCFLCENLGTGWWSSVEVKER